MGLTRFIVNRAVKTPKPDSFDRFLFVGPHPDDIEIGAGATAAKLAALGKKVCFLICTDGRFGDENLEEKCSPDTIAEIRRKEAVLSAQYLGIEDVRFLELSDGGFYSYEELKRKLAGVVGDFKPEVILAPDPCVANECHADHLNVGRASSEIAFFAPFDNIMQGFEAKAAPVQAIAYYMTAKPNRYYNTRGYLKKQIEALKKCHLSQFPAGSNAFDSIELYLKLRAAEFGIKNLSFSAEGFRVLGRGQMHCLPEVEKP